MNFTTGNHTMRYISNVHKFLSFSLLFITVPFILIGCSKYVSQPTTEQLAEFENVPLSAPAVDLNGLVRAKIGGGPYRIVPGDLLSLTMPAILHVVTAEETGSPDSVTPYVCRVSDNGTINLPVIGDIKVAGKSLAEIESAVIEAYYPEYTATRPLVVARIAEHYMAQISITGAVVNPGVYELRSDQMSLVALLMKAGGIVGEGAADIRIIRSGEAAANIKEAGLQLAFERLDQSSVTGRLTIRHKQTILLSEQINVTDETQRWSVLDKLAKIDHSISTDEVGRMWVKLCELPELLNNPGIQKAEGRRQKTEDRRQGNYSEPRLSRAMPREALASGKDDGRWTMDDGRTTRYDRDGDETIVLPVRGLNVPFADVALRDGDAVVVGRLEPRLFTVLGLVNEPGNFPYPIDVRYNLMQALAFAGGLDRAAEPRYATIYRLQADDKILNITFKIVEHSRLTNVLNTTIMPGDIIDVAHTFHTRTNVFLDRIFRIQVGAFIPLFSENSEN